MKAQKTSSSLKVGLLTTVAIIILIFTVLWIKGRSLSSGERIEIVFKDANGIRAGAGVQMMGLRVGQIEQVTPVIDGINSHAKVKFVITEKGVKVPLLSTISIQQSGLIGEQFLEITPPSVETLHIELNKSDTSIKPEQKIYMNFNGELKEIGTVVSANVLSTNEISLKLRERIKTKNTLKISYLINLAGLILDNNNLGAKLKDGKLVFYVLDGETIPYPKQTSPYTVIEPIRISEFMDLQFKAAGSLARTNDRIMEILSDDTVYEIQTSISNMNQLTSKAITTIDKAGVLLDNSKDDLNTIFKQTNKLVKSLIELTDEVEGLVGDKEFKTSVVEASKSFTRLSNNVNTLLEDKQTKEIISNLDEITKNVAEISLYVNDFAKDTKLKNDVKQTVSNINKVTDSVNTTLKEINALPDGEKVELKDAISDILVTTRNLRTFSQKLNKRFLLFRLMF